MPKVKIIATVLGVLVIGGAIYSYSVGANSTERILGRASDKVSSLNFLKEKFDVSFSSKDSTLAGKELPAGVYPTVNFSATLLTPKYDITNTGADIKSSTHIEVSTKNMEPSVSADADLIMLKQTLFYIRLNQLTGVPFNVSQFEKKWWKFDVEALAKKFGGEESDKILASLKGTQLSKEKIAQIKVIAERYKVLAHTTKLPDGQIDGIPAYHFTMVLDKTQLIKMLTEVMEVIQKDSTDKQDIKSTDIEEAFKQMDIKAIDIFVGKADYLPVQVKMPFEMSDTDGKDIGGVDMSIAISKSDPVEIAAPASSTDIMELISTFMSGMGNSGMVTPPTR